MSQPGLATQIGAATSYEEAVVPGLMREWAPRVVAEAVGPPGSVTGLDLDPGMLAIAARTAPGSSWLRGIAESLPFREATFEAVVSQFGLMFFEDRSRALREMWRVLRPGGRMAVAVWASLDETPAYAAEVELVERMAGSAAADVLRSPFALGDRAVLERTFAAAEIPLRSLVTQAGTGQFPSIRAMVDADLSGWLPITGVRLDPQMVERILTEAESVFQQYLTSDGTVRFASPAHIAVVTRSRS